MNKESAYKLGQAFRQGLAFFIGTKKGNLAMDAVFKEEDHPRDEEGKFIRKGFDGATHYTQAKKTDKPMTSFPAIKNVSQKKAKGSFYRGTVATFSKVAALPRNISDIPDSKLYKRSDEPKPEKQKGEATYTWTKGGKKVSEAEAFRVEEALRELGMSMCLTNLQKDVKVRPDLYNGRGQIFTCRNKNTGKAESLRDPFTQLELNSGKYTRVMDIVKKYDKVLDEIEKDIHSTNKTTQNAAMLAYFLHRTRCRIGTGSDKSFGASELTKSHIHINGDTVKVEFDAKNGHTIINVKDKLLADYIRKRKSELKPNERLFGTTADGENKYLASVGKRVKLPNGMKNHDMRRVGATLVVQDYLKNNEEKLKRYVEKGKTEPYNKILFEAVNRAAKFINDTSSVAFENYIAPEVLHMYDPSVRIALEKNNAGLGANEFDKYGA